MIDEPSGPDWVQQQNLDQEWLIVDGAIEAVCAGLRNRGDYSRAKELEAELRQRLGVQRREFPAEPDLFERATT